MTFTLYGQNINRQYKTGQHPPITSTVILVCDCLTSYTLGDLVRKSVLYHTSKFLKLEDDTQNNRIKTNCFACPDDAAWEKAQSLWRAAQDRAAKFAEKLRSLGSYSDCLQKAGGISGAVNPLTALVIAATEPDHPFPPSGVKWPLLRCDLHKCARHTLAMIEVDGFSHSNTGYRLTNQIDHFPVATTQEAAEVMQSARTAQEALHALRRYLEEELGTYQTAEADGRHARREEQVLSFDGSAEEELLTFDDALLGADLLPSESQPISSQGGLLAPGYSYLSHLEGEEALIALPSEAAALMRISLKIDELTEPPPATPQKKPVVLSISDIRLDGGTQQRYCLSPGALDEYTDHLKAGGDLPPVQVIHDGEAYWMVDGFHRIEAHVRAGLDAIFAFVEEGTQREAILKSVAANQQHGVRRSNFDKKNAAMTLLKDSEWGCWSDREIARVAGVSHTYVANLRFEVKGSKEAEKKRLERLEQYATDTADDPTPEPPAYRSIMDSLPSLKTGDYVSVWDVEMDGAREGLAQVITPGQYRTLIEWPDQSQESIPVENLTFKGHQHEIPLRDLVGGVDEVSTKNLSGGRTFAPGDRVRVLPPHAASGSIGLVAAGYAGISDRWIPVALEGWKDCSLFTAEQLELVEAGFVNPAHSEEEDEEELSFFDSLKVELSVLQTLYQVEQGWRIEADLQLDDAVIVIENLNAEIQQLREDLAKANWDRVTTNG